MFPLLLPNAMPNACAVLLLSPQATSQLIILSGFPGGVFDEMAKGVDDQIVVRSRRGVEVDAIGELLAAACHSPTSPGRHLRRRWEIYRTGNTWMHVCITTVRCVKLTAA